jgi:hypothetical protein
VTVQDDFERLSACEFCDDREFAGLVPIRPFGACAEHPARLATERVNSSLENRRWDTPQGTRCHA